MSGLEGQHDAGGELPPEELEQLLSHMQKEELQADDARLNSMESFELWVRAHPALRQMNIVEQLSQIGPAILQVLRGLLGL